MLKIEGVRWITPPDMSDTGETLFKKNPKIVFTISAPLFWWIDADINFSLESLSEYKCFSDFIFDEWASQEKIAQEIFFAIQEEQKKINSTQEKSFRRLIEIMPLGTIVKGEWYLDYKSVVQYVEDYLDGSMFTVEPLPTRREWSDLCETFLDLRGVRTYVREEELRGDE